jgi:CheY-like chemotaxis protein
MGELNLRPEGHFLNLSPAAVGVLIAEDFPPYRQFVCSTLAKRPELQVIAEVSDGLEAVQKAVELKPDLILLDIGLPTMNGIEAARRIRALVPNAKIIFLSQETSAEVVEEALSTGARAYVENDAQPRGLPHHREIDSAKTKTRRENIDTIPHMVVVERRNCLSHRFRAVGVSPAVVDFGMCFFDGHLQRSVGHRERNEVQPVPRTREPSGDLQPLV